MQFRHIMLSQQQKQVLTYPVLMESNTDTAAKDYEGLHNMYKKTRSEGFGAEVKRRIMLGSFVLSSGYYDAYYLKALRTKALIKKEFDKAFEKYDVILGPVSTNNSSKIRR